MGIVLCVNGPPEMIPELLQKTGSPNVVPGKSSPNYPGGALGDR